VELLKAFFSKLFLHDLFHLGEAFEGFLLQLEIGETETIVKMPPCCQLKRKRTRTGISMENTSGETSDASDSSKDEAERSKEIQQRQAARSQSAKSMND
jgi:hypothetical protein